MQIEIVQHENTEQQTKEFNNFIVFKTMYTMIIAQNNKKNLFHIIMTTHLLLH